MDTLKRRLLALLFAALFLCFPIINWHAGELVEEPGSSGNQVMQISPGHGDKYVPGQVLVRFKPLVSQEAGKTDVLLGAKVLWVSTLVDSLQLVQLPRQVTVEEAIREYRKNPDVLYAEPNYRVHALATPGDPDFPSLWGLHNTGQNGGTPGVDIHAPEAWELSTGSQDVVVAVIDTGIDYNHEDLAVNMFRNEADCNANGVDDDHNGYVDDCHGINMVDRNSDPMDIVGHGTHVAGTIGAVGNNGAGVTGVNWNVKLMACKFLGPGEGGGDVASAIACLEYVKTMKDHGVNIVATNDSWGVGYYTQGLEDAIRAHAERGILFIAAAGNEFSNNDLLPVYPANYRLPNVISVAAITRTGDRATFSNFGRRTVHLGAPGQEILSTTPDDTYHVYSGTSMAAPHVTGVAALLKAEDPGRDWRTIKNLILSGGNQSPALAQTITGRWLNAYGSMTCLDSPILTRLLPVANTTAGSIGTAVDLTALNIDCARPAGDIEVSLSDRGYRYSEG